MKKLSVVIPCYNEADSLPFLLNECRQACAGRQDIEFVFVNNGSKDNSSQVFQQLLQEPENHFATLVDVPVNKGYGYGILQGLYGANGEVLSWTHADLQTDPKDVIEAYEKYLPGLLNETAIVKGARIGRNFFDDLFTRGMSVISSVLLSAHVSDVNAQPKIFHRNFMKKLERAPYDFSLDLYLLYVARREKIKIETYPVHFGKRNFGEAKGGGTLKGKIKLIKRTFKYILELRKDLKSNER